MIAWPRVSPLLSSPPLVIQPAEHVKAIYYNVNTRALNRVTAHLSISCTQSRLLALILLLLVSSPLASPLASLPVSSMFVFKKAEKDKADSQEAATYKEVARTAALMFLFFAAVRVA
jgi:hypothetical protein